MRLSEAMVLGDSLRSRNPFEFLIWDANGNHCGCAIGGAVLAVGRRDWYDTFTIMWPWATATNGLLLPVINDISAKFHLVCEGRMTFEQLIDYVRSIEPECGECNRFICTCVKGSITSKLESREPVAIGI